MLSALLRKGTRWPRNQTGALSGHDIGNIGLYLARGLLVLSTRTRRGGGRGWSETYINIGFRHGEM
jgi:hypothetical protein